MEEIKSNLEKIWLKTFDWSKYNLLSILQWSDKYWKGWNILVSPQLPWKDILDLLWYQKNDNIYIDFQDKEITDIWAWLWWLIFELENSAKKINAVDPLYSSEEKNEILNEEVNRAKKRNEDLKHNAKTKNNESKKQISELEYLMSKMPWNQKLLFDKQDLENKIQTENKNININTKVFEDIKTRKERWFNNSDKINLIWESGENTKLPNSSQDYILINNVITKGCLNPYKLLAEASRILKPWWKIIIVDQHEEIKNIFEKFEKKLQKIWNGL